MATLDINGRKVTVDDAFLSLPLDQQNAVVEEISASLGATKADTKPAKKDTGYLGAVAHGTAGVAKGIGKTVNIASKGSGDGFEKAGDKLEHQNYEPASERFLNPTEEDTNVLGYGVNQLPRVVAESAPGFATDLAAAKAGSKVAGGKGALVGGLASFVLRNFGSEANERAQKRTGDAKAEPDTSDLAHAGVSTAAQAGLNQLGLSRFLKKSGGIVKPAAVEGGTEFGQDVISQVGTSINTPGGTEVDLHRAGGAGIAGAATGGAMRTPRALVDAKNSWRFKDFDPEASASLTARLDAHTENLGNTKNARDALAAAEKDIFTDLKVALDSDPSVKTAISQDIAATRAFARIKSNEAVTDADLNAITNVVSGSPNGSTVGLLSREAQTVRKLKQKGDFTDKAFKGGLSAKMDRGVRLINNPAGGLTATGLGAAGLATGHSAVIGAYAPIAAAGILSAYGGVRAWDKFSGTRSPAKTFADKFRDPNATVRNPIAPTPQQPVPQGPAPGPWGPTVVGANGPWGPRAARTVPAVAQPTPAGGPPAGFGTSLNRIVTRINRQEREALREQIKEATDLTAARRANEKLAKTTAEKEGEALADQVARQSPLVEQSGGFDTLSKPGFGARASKLVSAASAIRKLQSDPAAEAEEKAAAAEAKQIERADKAAKREAEKAERAKERAAKAEASAAAKAAKAEMAKQKVLDKQKARAEKPTKPVSVKAAKAKTEAPKADDDLPQSNLWHLEPTEAAEVILQRAKEGGKAIRHEAGFKAGTVRRLQAEQRIYEAISQSLPDTKTRQDFHKYLGALWGSDGPEVVKRVRERMKAEFPKHKAAISKHLSDEQIEGLWGGKK